MSALKPGALDNMDEVSQSEVAEQVNRQKMWKSVDDEGVFAELLKFDGEQTYTAISQLFLIARSEEVPEYCNNFKIMAFSKKGDKRLPNNHRPICITPILYRRFRRELLPRIHNKLDDAQSKDQAGFRGEFGCVDHLFPVTAITERTNEFGKLLWIAKVDFQKACNSIDHLAIWKALVDQEIEPAYVTLLRRLLDKQQQRRRTVGVRN